VRNSFARSGSATKPKTSTRPTVDALKDRYEHVGGNMRLVTFRSPKQLSEKSMLQLLPVAVQVQISADRYFKFVARRMESLETKIRRAGEVKNENIESIKALLKEVDTCTNKFREEGNTIHLAELDNIRKRLIELLDLGIEQRLIRYKHQLPEDSNDNLTVTQANILLDEFGDYLERRTVLGNPLPEADIEQYKLYIYNLLTFLRIPGISVEELSLMSSVCLVSEVDSILFLVHFFESVNHVAPIQDLQNRSITIESLHTYLSYYRIWFMSASDREHVISELEKAETHLVKLEENKINEDSEIPITTLYDHHGYLHIIQTNLTRLRRIQALLYFGRNLLG